MQSEIKLNGEFITQEDLLKELGLTIDKNDINVTI